MKASQRYGPGNPRKEDGLDKCARAVRDSLTPRSVREAQSVRAVEREHTTSRRERVPTSYVTFPMVISTERSLNSGTTKE